MDYGLDDIISMLHILIMQEHVPVLRKCTPKYLGVKVHDVCNLLLNGSEKNLHLCVCVERIIKPM